MKTKITITTLVLSILLIRSTTVLAQGELTPPGPPEPSMKSLSQIEPRVPISEPMIIEAPGSYYLIHDIIVEGGTALTIATDGVSLDLNGFTIRSVATAPMGTRGIHLAGDRRNITIVNGFIEGGVTNNGGIFEGNGFGAGIYSDEADDAVNILVRNISVSGCQNNGIHLDLSSSTVVESCTVQTVGNYGIAACTIKNCIAMDCGNNAIYGHQVSDCLGRSIIGSGIYAVNAQNCWGYTTGNGSAAVYAHTALNCSGLASLGGGAGVEAVTAVNCSGNSNSDPGISTETAESCYGISFSSDGVYASSAENCTGTSSGGTGVYALHTALNCRGQSLGGTGIFAETAQNCSGQSNSSDGIRADTVLNCRGYSASGTGVSTITAQNCYGFSNSSNGIWATTVVQNSYGLSSDGYGIGAPSVQNSYGVSTNSSGIVATIVQNSFGYTHSGNTGLSASYVAIGSGGSTVGTGTGIYGYILNACHGFSSGGTAIQYNYKFNMP